MIFKKPKGNQNKMKPRGRKRKLFASAMLILRLFFGGLQSASASSNPKTFQSGGNSKTEISRTLDQESSMIANLNQEDSTRSELVPEGGQLTLNTPSGQITLGLPRGGEWQPKSGPGPRAKADARANAGVRKTGQTASSGSSIFVEGYIPHNIYCNHYHKDGNMPSCRQAHNNICPPDDQGKYLKLDQDGYCINERGKKFVRVEHEHKQAKFETPKNQNDPVQEASEVTGTETTTLTTDIRKRQVHAKSKHKDLFENPDGSPIDTYTEFKDSQVRFLKDKSDSKYVSDCILLGEGSEPKDAACVIDDKTRNCFVLEKTQRWNSETKSMEESPILDYVGPRKLSKKQYEKFKRYGIIGFDGKDISQAQHGMRAKELMEIRSNQIDPFGDSDTCSLNEE